MKRIALTATAAALLVAGSIAPAEASSSAAPRYQEGPSNGDESTYHSVDTSSGEITIFQHNTRQAGTVHCVGEGPRATLVATDVAKSSGVRSVVVNYADALMTEHPIIDVLIEGRDKRILGHGATFGPKYYESGSVTAPFFRKPDVGEPLRILIGLQVHAGCLPHPFVLGLPGSRFVEGARVTFPSYAIQ
jgi:hypothetical protein